MTIETWTPTIGAMKFVDGTEVPQELEAAAKLGVGPGTTRRLLEIIDLFKDKVFTTPLEFLPYHALTAATLICASVQIRRFLRFYAEEEYETLVSSLEDVARSEDVPRILDTDQRNFICANLGVTPDAPKLNCRVEILMEWARSQVGDESFYDDIEKSPIDMILVDEYVTTTLKHLDDRVPPINEGDKESVTRFREEVMAQIIYLLQTSEHDLSVIYTTSGIRETILVLSEAASLLPQIWCGLLLEEGKDGNIPYSPGD